MKQVFISTALSFSLLFLSLAFGCLLLNLLQVRLDSKTDSMAHHSNYITFCFLKRKKKGGKKDYLFELWPPPSTQQIPISFGF